MQDKFVPSQPWPPRDEAARGYLLDMLEQLARLARTSNETSIAILLEAIIAADAAMSTVR